MKRLKKRKTHNLQGDNKVRTSKNYSDKTLFKSQSKYIAIAFVFLLFISITKAQSFECPAGHSCENDLKTPCEVGWYSLKGETTCSRCKPGKLVNFQFSSTRRNYMTNHDRSSNQMQRWRVFTMVLHKMRALSSR